MRGSLRATNGFYGITGILDSEGCEGASAESIATHRTKTPPSANQRAEGGTAINFLALELVAD